MYVPKSVFVPKSVLFEAKNEEKSEKQATRRGSLFSAPPKGDSGTEEEEEEDVVGEEGLPLILKQAMHCKLQIVILSSTLLMPTGSGVNDTERHNGAVGRA